jgi:hypothetical protein
VGSELGTPEVLCFQAGAEGGIRTPTELPPPAPQASARKTRSSIDSISYVWCSVLNTFFSWPPFYSSFFNCP